MAGSALDPLQQFIKEQLTCSICLEQYKEPKGLPCQHSFCKECLDRIPQELRNGKYLLKCPSCRKTVQLPDGGASALPPAFTINNFLELHQIMLSKGNSVECSRHKESLDIYCYTCQQAICHKCAYRCHREHNHDLIDDVFEQVKRQIVTNQELVRQKRVTVADCSQTIAAREREIRQQGEAVKQKIHLRNKKIKTMLDTVKEQLMEEIDAAVEEKLCLLSIQADECKCALSMLSSCEEFVDQSLKVGSHLQVIASKEELKKKMNDVSSHVDIANLEPAEPADITFSESKLPTNYELFGIVQHSHLREKLHVLEDSFKKTMWFQTSCITLGVRDANDYPIPIPASLISYQLTASNGPQPIDCTIEAAGQNKYKISFTPITIGPHQLRVMVGNGDIQGSPFRVFVSSVPPRMKGQAMNIITGLDRPESVAVSSSGKIAVYESGAECITVMNREGKKLRSFGSHGTVPGDLEHRVGGLAFTVDEHLVVANFRVDRIQLFSTDGQYMNSAATPKGPVDVTVHSNGQIFVSCCKESCVAVFNPDLTLSHLFGKCGSEPGQLQYPWGITTDRQGKVYVTDAINRRIEVYSSSGKYLRQFTKEHVSHFKCIASDLRDNIYVSMPYDCKVHIFSKNGQLIHTLNHGVNTPVGLAVDYDNNLYMCNQNDDRITIF